MNEQDVQIFYFFFTVLNIKKGKRVRRDKMEVTCRETERKKGVKVMRYKSTWFQEPRFPRRTMAV